MIKLKNHSANNISLVYSGIFTILLAVSLSIGIAISGNLVFLYYILFIIPICFAISFLSLRFLVASFIADRIKFISNSIHKEKKETNNRPKECDFNEDKIDKLEKDLESWVNEQKSKMELMSKMMEFRKEYVGNVSHELKTPIFNIQGFTLTLLEGGLEDKTINKKYLQKINNNINRMIDIVSSLETITKLGSVGFSLNLTKTNPISICNSVVRDLEDMAKKKKIAINIRKKYLRDNTAKADVEYLKQVFTNIIINAIYYNKEGGKIDITFSEIDEKIFIEISDNGVGISAQDLDRIFERFYRTKESRRLNEGGHGLGLAIVKNIIDAHRQTLSINSTLDIGTTITFSLDKAE